MRQKKVNCPMAKKKSEWHKGKYVSICECNGNVSNLFCDNSIKKARLQLRHVFDEFIVASL